MILLLILQFLIAYIMCSFQLLFFIFYPLLHLCMDPTSLLWILKNTYRSQWQRRVKINAGEGGSEMLLWMVLDWSDLFWSHGLFSFGNTVLEVITLHFTCDGHQLNLVTWLEQRSKHEVQAVRFVNVRDVASVEIHCPLVGVYGNYVMSWPRVA